MDEVIEAITSELIDALEKYSNWQVDESGAINPDRHDNEGSRMKMRIEALRKLRTQAEEIILL